MELKQYLNTLTLLCVDSSSVITTIYDGVFNILFKKVLFAQNTEDALEIYQNESIDIIITAQVFSGLSGIEMIKILREKDKNIPIIFATSFEEVELLTEAIELKVTSFIKKPFEMTDLLDAVENATRYLLAQKYIEEENRKKLLNLKKKVDYSNYQENLSFQKALKVIRNDYYYKYLSETEKSVILLDILYTAKDIISGDTYSARKIDDNRNLFFIIDGMGKGLSASITAMLTVTFINRSLDANKEENIDFCLTSLIEKVLKNVKTILLDDEILSISFLLVDTKKENIEYAFFSMPPMLVLNSKDEVETIKSNNPPMTIYTQNFKTDQFFYKDIEKLLIYSDGLVENSLKNENETYVKYIKEDFKNSITREELRKKITSKIADQEDDITFILITNIYLNNPLGSLIIDSTLKELDRANLWFEQIINKQLKDPLLQTKSALAFSELLLNAYEHGNLRLCGKKKHTLIENDKYFDFLSNEEKKCTKKIFIDIHKFNNHLIIKIEDEGEGFDTKILSTIFGLNKTFNRRGVFMSRNSSLGIYYNQKANKIRFIVPIS